MTAQRPSRVRTILEALGKTAYDAVRDRLGDEAPLRGNAPVDPLDDELSPAELASRYRILRASALVDGDCGLGRYKDLALTRPDAFFAPRAIPELLLFVSHRWQSLEHPDPDGRHEAAVRGFLQTIRTLATAAGLAPNERLQLVPSLRIHGVFQAADLLGSQQGFGLDGESRWSAFCREVVETHEPADVGAAILDGIGVWFDYACVPTSTRLALELPDPEDDRLLLDALRGLHNLVAASRVLILRREGDDYGQRAWCAAELAVGQPAWRHNVLRTDRLGSRVSDRDLLGDEPPEINTFELYREGLVSIDDEWSTWENGWGALSHVTTSVFMGLPELEGDRAVPMFRTGHAPHFFPGHRSLLGEMIGRLSYLSQLDHAAEGAPLVVDVAEMVVNALELAGLHCADPADRVYAGLLILYSRHVGAPEFAGFYGECLRRHVDGRTTRLARYRELRDGLTMRSWFVFADEPAGSERWKVPRWARRA